MSLARPAGQAHAPSWYAASVPETPLRPALQGETQADVCVLGAGYTGLSAALSLAERGYRVTVLEAQRVGWGASGRNGGQAIVGFGCEVDTLEQLVGKRDARTLFDYSREGMALLRQRLQRYQIACDWRDGHASVAINARQERELRRGMQRLVDHYDYPLQWWDRAQLRDRLDSRVIEVLGRLSPEGRRKLLEMGPPR